MKKERAIDALYLGRNDNRSGHPVFKLGTRTEVSVNQVKVIPIPSSVIDRVNEISKAEK